MAHRDATNEKRLQIAGYRHKKGYTLAVTVSTDLKVECNQVKPLRHKRFKK